MVLRRVRRMAIPMTFLITLVGGGVAVYRTARMDYQINFPTSLLCGLGGLIMMTALVNFSSASYRNRDAHWIACIMTFAAGIQIAGPLIVNALFNGAPLETRWYSWLGFAIMAISIIGSPAPIPGTRYGRLTSWLKRSSQNRLQRFRLSA